MPIDSLDEVAAITRALLVEDNEGDLKLLHTAVGETAAVGLELCHVNRLGEAVSRLGREKFDVVLLDLSLPDSKGLNTVCQARRAAPDIPILVLTGLDDEAMAVQALAAGAQDYLVKGQFDGFQLARAVRYARARRDAEAVQQGKTEAPHKLIGLLGAKGGCGGTTVACHLAAELGRQTGAKTLLADLDFVTGSVGFLMKATSPHSVLEAVERVDVLDSDSWQAVVSSTGRNLDILAAPSTLAGRVLPRPEQLARLLEFVRRNYSWGVVDLGSGLSEPSLRLLDHLDLTLMVTTADVLAVARSKRIVEALVAGGFPRERFRVVVNRLPKRPQITVRQIEGVLRLPVDATLPDDSDQLAACTLRSMLVARGTGLGEQFATLAAKLAGLEQPVAKRRWFSFRKRPAELRAEVENEAARSVNESVCALLDNPQATANGNAPVAASPLLNRELARTKAELEQLAYAAGHDLREPARLISSYVQLLAERSKSRLDEEANDLIASAMDGVGQLLERLDGLVQYSRVTTRGAEFQPVNCKDVLDRVLASLDEPIAESGAQVTQENLPTVLADPNQVRTVFHHLLANALTFRSVDPPKVRVRAEAGDGEWVFAVEDNGIGIDPQYAQRIFEVFQRLHTRAERPGVGVGLAVTKRIVERHGGRIWVESSPGTGATFYFTLPDCPADLVSQPAGICESHSEPMALAAPPQCIN